MCGIAGYIGKNEQVNDSLITVLEKLEYRGYDSSGLASYLNNSKFVYKRALGDLQKLKEKIKNTKDSRGGIGIAHTRWATHGKPAIKNAHPHKHGSVYLVHNGIIENYKELKEFLESKGCKFKSDTDSEVIAALIDFYIKQGNSVRDAFKYTLNKLKGAFAILFFSETEPDKLFAARLSSPLVLGLLDNGDFLLASDVLAISDKVKRVIYLNDYEMLELNTEFYKIDNFRNGKSVKSVVKDLELDLAGTDKGEFDSYMLKEIYEQPDALRASLQGRIDKKTWAAVLGGLSDFKEELKNASEIHFVASGTSLYAAMSVKDLFEDLLELSVKLVFASEANPKPALIKPGTIAFFISQSGETADTLSALEKYKKIGVLCFGIVNTVASSIARKTHAGVYNHAGPEISVASTKAFSSQVAVLILVASFIAQTKAMKSNKTKRLLRALLKLPEQMESTLEYANRFAARAAKQVKDKHSIYFLARRELLPLAYEAALKAKEISYIHAEAYPAGELKHGPIALIEKGFPTFFILARGKLYNKLVSNMQEIKARGAKIFALGVSEMDEAKALSDKFLELPETDLYVQTLVYVLPVQLFAYHLAKERGLNVDKPRNLAKSVTVE